MVWHFKVSLALVGFFLLFVDGHVVAGRTLPLYRPVVPGDSYLTEHPELEAVRSLVIEKGERKFACQGTFISDSVLITAAHCVPTATKARDVVDLKTGARSLSIRRFSERN